MRNIKEAINALKSQFGEQLSTAHSICSHHGQNETYFDYMPPDAVFFPRSTLDVSKAVKIASHYKCPIIPWGVGTSLEGHALPVQGGVTMSFERMNKVIEIYQSDLSARVQPGITRETLNKELKATGLFFPVDPGADATIGGMAATRASGTTTVRYGTMKENITGLEIVTATGDIIKTGTRAKKSSSGYDLTKLFIGSEGTLGIITELTVKLHGQPEAVSAAICRFPDIEKAVDATIEAIQMGLPLARCELVDAQTIEAINEYSKMDFPIAPYLFMEFHGSDAFVKETAETMEEIAQSQGGDGFQWTIKQEERTKLWAARHNAYWAIKAKWPHLKGMATDVCVPISELAGAIEAAKQDIASSGLIGPIVGHVGDGNFHSSLLCDASNPQELSRAKKVAENMAHYALSVGGTVTGEHGIGVGKMKFMREEHGAAVDMMIAIKRALDPDNIMNPGKMLPMN